MDIVLNINIDDLDLNEKIGGYYDEDGDFVGGKTVAAAVVAALVAQATKGDYYSGLKKRVEEVRDEEIRAAIAPILAEAIAKPLVKTNSYGEPVGKETTLREVILEEARKIWEQPVDRYARDKGTHLQAAIRKEVQAAFAEEVAEAVRVAREAVAKEIGGSIADVVTKAVRTGLSTR